MHRATLRQHSCLSSQLHEHTRSCQGACALHAMQLRQHGRPLLQVREVTEYRREVYKLVRKVLEESPRVGVQALGWNDAEWALLMGFEHERIHIETSSVLIRELPLELVQEPMWVCCPALSAALSFGSSPAPQRYKHPSGSCMHLVHENVHPERRSGCTLWQV
jgi:hypothetical protein